MTLRLVKPEEPRPPRKKYTRCPPALTALETRQFKQALRNMRDAMGTWGALAAAMQVSEAALNATMRGDNAASGDLVIKAMKASGIRSLDELLGTPTLAGTCRACGAVRRAS